MSAAYTVILIYPDYIVSNYGEEFWISQVMALSVNDAVRQTRQEAVGANFSYLGSDMEGTNPEDFAVVAVFSGHHDDLSYLLKDDE